MKTFGVIKETSPNETRVALVPEVVAAFVKDGNKVIVEAGAGIKSGFSDEDYVAASATIVNREQVFLAADCLFTVDGRGFHDVNVGKKIIAGLFDPYFNQGAIKKFCAEGTTVLALEAIPRTSRAQSMDVLSSQANIAGYIAVIMAADRLNKVMPLMMTAAGTVTPAKLLVVGAGVAGLQAIATAKRLGALVYAFDVRSVVKEQVESLGGKFVDIKIEETGEGSGGYAKALTESSEQLLREKLTAFCKDMDCVITTAQIPGRKAPRLLNDDIFSSMKSDSVIIDMAAASGGNVDGARLNEWVRRGNCFLYGADHLARLKAKDASFTFAKNLHSLSATMFTKEGALNLSDDIIGDAVLCHEGRYINQTFKKFIEGGA